MADPGALGLLSYPWQDLWWEDCAEEHLQACWELWEGKEPLSSKVPPESEVWVDLWHVLQETWTDLEELVQEKERLTLPVTYKDACRHSTPRPQEVVESPRCINAEIEWYWRMITDAPLVDPKGERLLGQYEEEDAIAEAMDPMTDKCFPYWDG